MRIVFFLPQNNVGGAEVFTQSLCEQLSGQGHEVHLIYAKSGGNSRFRHKNDRYLNARNLIMAIPSLISCINRMKPDIIMSSVEEANAVFSISAPFMNRRIRKFIRIPNSDDDIRRKKLFYRCLILLTRRYLYHRCDGVVAISKGIADSLNKKGKLRSKVVVIHNSIRNVEYQRLSRPEDIPGRVDYILSVGRLEEQKNLKDGIYAFYKSGFDGDYFIIGEGSQREELLSYIDELGLAGRVKLLGKKEDVFGYMKFAKLLLFPSLWEGFGIVVAEALAVGCPVIAYDCDYGPREIINSNSVGVLVPIGDKVRLSQQLDLANDIKFNREAAIAQGRSFSLSSATSKYLSLFGEKE